MIFIYVGLVAWTIFAGIVSGCVNSVPAGAALLTKNRFPRLLLPLAATTVAVVDGLILLAILPIGYALSGSWPEIGSLTFFLPSLLTVVLVAFAVGVILAAINVYVRDIVFLTDTALQIGFWLCPIVYSYGFVERAAESYGLSVEWVTRIYMLNPMANSVLGFQRALWPPASTPEGALFSFPGQLEARIAVLLIISVMLCAGAAYAFSRMSRNFAQEF